MRHIITTTLSLVGATTVTSGLGFLYWWLAARAFSPAAVGFAAALVSAMTLLGTISDLGLGTMLIGQLSRQPEQEWPLITAALLTTGVIGGLLGLAAAIISPAFSVELAPLGGSAGTIGLFALGVSLTGISLVLDQALVGLLQGHLQFWRNTVFAAVKLIALGGAAWWMAERVGLALFATWVGGLVVSLLGVIGIIMTRNRGRTWRRPQWTSLWSLGRLSLAHYGLNLALNIAPLTLPLVVTALLTATANAYFYAAWMIASFLATVPLALTVSLYAVGSAAPTELSRKIRLTITLALVVGGVGSAGLLVGADLILRIYGATYAEHAGWSLRILGLCVFPVIIKNHYVAIRRVQRRVASAALAMAGGGLLEVALAASGAEIAGLTGLCMGWLVALCLEAILTMPAVYRAVVPSAVPAREQLRRSSAVA
jgi:O-antigen/teichoic acid export membrane protein